MAGLLWASAHLILIRRPGDAGHPAPAWGRILLAIMIIHPDLLLCRAAIRQKFAKGRGIFCEGTVLLEKGKVYV